MKIRNGFVSNSSSSSFVINKENLSPKQIKKIKCHEIDVTKESGKLDSWNKWEITEDKNTISGTTHMDNFDMEAFLERIGVNSEDIEWNHGHW
jgi:hypothetical protein